MASSERLLGRGNRSRRRRAAGHEAEAEFHGHQSGPVPRLWEPTPPPDCFIRCLAVVQDAVTLLYKRFYPDISVHFWAPRLFAARTIVLYAEEHSFRPLTRQLNYPWRARFPMLGALHYVTRLVLLFASGSYWNWSSARHSTTELISHVFASRHVLRCAARSAVLLTIKDRILQPLPVNL